MPKSTRRARPSGSQSTFAVVTSRWTTSLLVDRREGVGQLAHRAPATSLRRSGPSSARRAARVGPSTSSSTRYASSPCSPASYTRTRSGGPGRRAGGPRRRSARGRAARRTGRPSRPRAGAGPVVRLVHVAHPAARDVAHQLVAVREARTRRGRGGGRGRHRGPYPPSAPRQPAAVRCERGRSVGGPGGGERGAAGDRRRSAHRRRARAPRRGGPGPGRRPLRRTGRPRRGGRRVQPLDLGRPHRRRDRRHRPAPPHRTACSAPRSSTRRRSAPTTSAATRRFGGLVARRPPGPRRVPRGADRVPRRRRRRLLPGQQGRRLHRRRRAPGAATWPPTPRC